MQLQLDARDRKLMKTIPLFLCFAIFTHCDYSLASATSSDFAICEKQKLDIFERCNQDRQGECNQLANSHYEECLIKVKQRFNHNSQKKLAAEKRPNCFLGLKILCPNFSPSPR